MRIELADTPGSLAGVADTIARCGGNITAIDLQDGSASSAVDEITVQFADDVDLNEIRESIGAGGVARVVSYQTAKPVDLVVRVLHRLTALLEQSDDPDEALRRAATSLCATPAVWVMPFDEAARYEAGRLAIEDPGAMIAFETDEPLPPLGEAIPGTACLLAIASRPLEGNRVLLVARPATQGFTPTEANRLEALFGFCERLSVLAQPLPGLA